MKLLWLTPIFPYPPFSGGQTRSYNLLKNLAKDHQITLFSFWRPNRIQGPITEMKKFCVQIKTFPGRPIWSAGNVLRAGFSSLPFTISHFAGDQSVVKALRQELSSKGRRYDVAHFESFYTSPYLTDFGVPTVLGNENVEYRIYQRLAEQKKPPLSWLMQLDVAKMRRYERAAWQRADLNLAVSAIDAREVTKVTGRSCPVIANGVDFAHFERFKPLKPFEPFKPVLLFVGDFKYFTNQDAIKFLVNEIWPRVKGQATIRLVGRNPGNWLKNLQQKGIVVDTQVDDIRQAYANADLLVAPMRIASGTNIKILEAMAAGLPVVTTKVGIEGIAGRQAVVIADQPAQFSQAVLELIANPIQRQHLARAGKRIVKQKYDWPRIAKKLTKTYEDLIRHHS